MEKNRELPFSKEQKLIEIATSCFGGGRRDEAPDARVASNPIAAAMRTAGFSVGAAGRESHASSGPTTFR